MAVTYWTGTGDGSDTTFPYSFPSFKKEDIKVRVSNVLLDNYTIASYTTSSGGTITFDNGTPSGGTLNSTYCESSGAPKNGLTIHIYRDTEVDTAKATYAAGSAVKAGDLNNNQTQVLYAAQEEQNLGVQSWNLNDDTILSQHIVDGTIVTADIADNAINSQHYVDGSIDTIHIGDDQVTYAKVQNVSATDRVLGRDSSGAGIIEEIAPAALRTMINVEDGATADQSNAEIRAAVEAASDSNVFTDADHSKLNAIDTNAADDQTAAEIKTLLASDKLERAHIADDIIGTDQLADNSVDGNKLADNIDIAGTLDVTGATTLDSTLTVAGVTQFNGQTTLATTTYVNGALEVKNDLNLKADNRSFIIETSGGVDKFTVDSDNGNTVIKGSLTVEGATTLADDSIGADELAADAVVNASVAAGAAIAHSKLAAVSSGNVIVGNGSNVPTSVAMSGDVAIAAGGATTIQANAVEIGMIGCEQTTISDSDSHIPTSGAVVDYVTSRISNIGGLEVIDDDESFPNSDYPAGVVISITDAAGLSVNSSGVSTNADTLNNSTVTINGFPPELRGGVGGNADPYVFASGAGLMVVSTGSSNTYDYHQAMIRESDFVQLSDDINDFNSRYRIAGSAPGSDNDAGDLYFDTGTDKMYVRNAANNAWGEVTSTGDFKYLFLCPAGGTGAPTLTNTTFDLRESSNSGSAASVTSAAQLIVSINGVIQKANTGTSAPAEGFALVDANTIIFGGAPGVGSSIFIVQIGSAISINTPGDGTVNEAKIAVGAVSHTRLAADCVDGDNIQDDVINSEHIAAGAIDNEHLANNCVNSAQIVDGAVTAGEIAANAVGSSELADDAVDLAEMAHGTQGDILYYAASGVPTRLGAGTNGQYLKTQGSSANPVWAAGSSGTITALNNQTANRVTTIGATTTELDGEANLTFDGTKLIVGGSTSVSVNDGDTPVIQVNGTDYSDSEISVTNFSNDTKRAQIVIGKSRGGSVGSNTIVNNNDTLGTLTFCGDDGTNLLTPGARITAEVDGTPGTNDLPTELCFYTTPDGAAAPTKKATIGPAGNLTISDGDLVIGTSGHGIDFSATTNNNNGSYGGTMGDELLHDYEYGTWTPVIKFNGGTTGQSYSVQDGRYTKVGNVVHIQANINVTDKGTSTGNITMGGLPWLAKSNGGMLLIQGDGFAYSGTQCWCLIGTNANHYWNVQQGGSGSSANWVYLTEGAINNGNYYLSGSYIAND